MHILAAILLFGAAFEGLFPFTYFSRHQEPPKSLVWAHIALAALGVLSLLIYAIATPNPDKHWASLIMFGIAGILGILLAMSSKPLSKLAWLAAYTTTGMFALFWFLSFIIPQA